MSKNPAVKALINAITALQAERTVILSNFAQTSHSDESDEGKKATLECKAIANEIRELETTIELLIDIDEGIIILDIVKVRK